jgi:hypothetical protein
MLYELTGADQRKRVDELVQMFELARMAKKLLGQKNLWATFGSGSFPRA